jgi:peptide/nickel transport system substrate-binding protein
MFTEQYQEIPQLAQVVKQDAAKVGVNINLKIETQTAYYGKATYGNSDWLDGTMSLVDYGDRGAPNVYLEAPLTSQGPWNAARFKNKDYDSLVKKYVAALDLQTQKQLAGQIQRLLRRETPIVIPYWIDGLTASTPAVGGLNPTATAQIYLNTAYKSA